VKLLDCFTDDLEDFLGLCLVSNAIVKHDGPEACDALGDVDVRASTAGKQCQAEREGPH